MMIKDKATLKRVKRQHIFIGAWGQLSGQHVDKSKPQRITDHNASKKKTDDPKVVLKSDHFDKVPMMNAQKYRKTRIRTA